MHVIIGTTTVDLLVSGLSRMPRPDGDEFTGESLVFCEAPLRLSVGGNGANTAYVLGRLGAAVTLCSAVGRDALGDLIAGRLAGAGVRLEGLVRSEREATATTTILAGRALDRLAFHHPGPSVRFRAEDVPPGLPERARTLLVTGYPLLPGWRPDGAARVLRAARRAGAVTALDLGPMLGPRVTPDELRPFAAEVELLLCNERELAAVTGEGDLAAGLARLFEAGARCVVVKRGARGAVTQRRGGAPVEVPGFPVEARSTVGAGDAFNAGLLFATERGAELPAAVRYANAVASLVVAAEQGVDGAPAPDAVVRMLEGQGPVEERSS